MRKLIVVLMAFGFAVAAFAATNRWKGPDGGNWNNDDNWSFGHVPTADESVEFTGTAAITVNIDCAATASTIYIGNPNNTLTEPAGGVTFTGTGTISPELATGIKIEDWQSLTFDGANYDGHAIAIGDKESNPGATASLIVKSGSEVRATSYSIAGSASDTAILRIDGGKVWTPGIDTFANGSRLVMTSGELHARKGLPTVDSLGKVEIAGGKLFLCETSSFKLDDSRFLPKGTAKLITLSAASTALNFGGTAELSGSLYVTNGTAAGFWAESKLALFGNGELFAGAVDLPLSRTDLDVSKFCLASKLNPRSSNSDTRLDFWDPVEIGGFGDWGCDNRKATINWHAPVTVNTTDCFDGTTARTITLDNVYPRPGSSLSVTGTGTANLILADGTVRYRFDTLSVGAGATLNAPDALLKAGALTLAANARILLAAGRGIDAYSATIDPTAAIVAQLPDSPVEGRLYPILSLPEGTTTPDPSVVTIANPSGNWQVAKFGSTIVLTDGKIPAATENNEWTGNVDANWSTPDNWKGGAMPLRNTVVYFSGTNRTSINYDATTDKLTALYFKEGGPYVLSGLNFKSLPSYGLVPTTYAPPITSYANLPVVIKNDISSIGQSGRACVYSAGDSYIELDGTVTAATDHTLIIAGDVRIGGTTTVKSICSAETVTACARPAELTVLSGGRLVCLNEATDPSDTYSMGAKGALSVNVEKGGEWIVSGGEMMFAKSATEHRVDGLFDCRVPLWMSKANVTMRGKGTVSLASVKSTATTANATLTVGGGLTVRPASWTTVTANAPDNFINLAVETKATLGATNDWTYGVAEGVETTTAAADRALALTSALSVLTVDTADPEDGTLGHVITFADPIAGKGTVKKTGVGTLVLASDANDVGAIDVREGVLAWTCDQTVPKFAAAEEATLAFGAADGVPAKLSVLSDFDLTGVTVAPFDDAAAATVANRFATVLEAADGAELSGSPAESDKYRFRVVDGKLQAKQKTGLLMLLR